MASTAESILGESFPDVLIPVSCVVGLLFAYWSYVRVSKIAVGAPSSASGSDYLLEEDTAEDSEVRKKAADIQQAIASGAHAFLMTEYRCVGKFAEFVGQSGPLLERVETSGPLQFDCVRTLGERKAHYKFAVGKVRRERESPSRADLPLERQNDNRPAPPVARTGALEVPSFSPHEPKGVPSAPIAAPP